MKATQLIRSRTLANHISFVLLVSLALICGLAATVAAQEKPAYKDTSLPIEKRVSDIVSRMTLEEKVSQMMDNAKAVDRLGVPAFYWWGEALHGVARSGNATVFPQAIGLAATWDVPLMHRIADVISTEARAKYHEAVRTGKTARFYGLTFWSPNINLFRDPRWGRGQETYGEDPFLTARMGVAFVKGMQGNDPRYLKTVSTPKHYAVHSGPEPLRHRFDATVSLRDMADTYLPAFRATVMEAKAYSVMCAYNSVNGQPACANDYLMRTLLRGKFGFRGYVVSDCGAVGDIFTGHKYAKSVAEASAIAVKTGTDLDCGDEYKSLLDAVKQGFISEAEIDVAVKRLFEARFRLGEFDPPEMVPYAKIPFSENDSEPHRALALDAARKSIVLLKNENNFLPFKKDIKKIAVIGPNADAIEVLLGNYNGIPSRYSTPLQGIRKRFGEANVTYAQGSSLAAHMGVLVPSSALKPAVGKEGDHGLTAEYFKNRNLVGPPLLTRVDAEVNIDSDVNPDEPAPGIGRTEFSVRWTGELVPPTSGTYWIGAIGDDGFRVYLDDKLLVEDWTSGGTRTRTAPVTLEKGKSYRIKMEYFQGRWEAVAKLVWELPTLKDEAIAVARTADVVVAVLGISPRLEGEEMNVQLEGFAGGDRTSLDLPRPQEELLGWLHEAGKPIVVVLLNASPLSVNWAQQNAAAIVEAWYPGEEGGTAVAETLAGDNNPAGRLPVTFYKSVDQLPDFSDYSMKNRTYRYFEGEPLYPFGFGLSYSKFKYSNLKISAPQRIDGNVQITVTVENTSERTGDEVVQLYVSYASATVPVPIRSLAGFERVHLKPRQKQRVTFTVQPSQLAVINENGERVLQPGKFLISVGGRQPDSDALAKQEVIQGKFTLSGKERILPD